MMPQVYKCCRWETSFCLGALEAFYVNALQPSNKNTRLSVSPLSWLLLLLVAIEHSIEQRDEMICLRRGEDLPT